MSDVPLYPLMVVAAIGVVNLFAMARLIRSHQIISPVGGLHLNLAVYFVMGPLFYLFVPQSFERQPYHETVAYIGNTGVLVLGGYLIWVLVETLFVRTVGVPFLSYARAVPADMLMLVGAASMLGYIVSQNEIAASGAGTVFVVLKNLLFPTLLLALCRVRRSDYFGIALAVLAVTVYVGLGAASAWRSDLVLTGMCVLLYVMLNAPRLTVPAVLVSLAILWLGLPTLQVKKLYYAEYLDAPVATILRSQDLTSAQRTDMLAEFMSSRVNSMREVAYVERGLDVGLMTKRGGDSYVDAVVQLVPRVVWSNKPSFNYSLNYVVPRQIGLVAWEDPNTSWSVNAYAECALNYRSEALLWFIPLLYLAFTLLGKAVNWLYTSPSVRGYASAMLFFQAFNLVGVVNQGTYLLWGLLLLKLVELQLARDRRV